MFNRRRAVAIFVFTITLAALSFTAAGSSAAGSSFLDSVKEYFGVAPVETSALNGMQNGSNASMPNGIDDGLASGPKGPTVTTLLVEDFNYTAGDLLTAHAWNVTGTAASPAIAVSSPGLTYTGYPSSGTGNAASLASSGEDDNKTFTSQTSGTVYAAAMVNVSAANTAGDYFFNLGPSPIGSTFVGRVFVKRDVSNNLAFGIVKTSAGTTAYTPFSYSLNTTYLIVVKYSILAGTNNDTVDLFINPVLNGTEPSSTVAASDSTGTDLANVGAVALRQGSASNAATLKVDGIRVGTTWANATSSNVTVTYDANGGTGSQTDASSPYFYGGTVSVLDAGSILRSGYAFTGWNTAADGSGTSYIAGNTFAILANTTLFAQWTPSSSAPFVSASAATSVGSTSATLNGNVTADGGSTVTDRGFVYKTSSGVTISDNKTVAAEGATGTGAITLVPALNVNTQYFFRAYAINVIGTTLSTSEPSFWTLANVPTAPTVGNPTASSLDVAIGTGDGNPGATVYAIQETTSGNYVQAGGTLGASAVYLTAAGWATKTVTGLGANTTYTFKVKAQNGGGTDTLFGGTASGLTSPGKPTVTSSAAAGIGATSATLNGNVTGDGGAAVTDRGFVYNTTGGTTIADNKTVAAEGATGTGAITLAPTLAVNTQYYFKAYAINTAGTTLSSPELNFWTLANVPTAPTFGTSTQSSLDIYVGGSGNGNPANTVYAIHETTQNKYVQGDGTLNTTPVFQKLSFWSLTTVTGLAGNTTYTFEIKARNGALVETAFGPSASGTTSPVAPLVTTQAASSVTTIGATLNGTVTSDNGSAITERGFYWSSTPTVTTSSTKIIEGGTSVSAFSSALGGLNPNVIYYYRAYAANSLGATLDTADTSFYTLANVPTAPTVGGATSSTLNVTIGSGDNNPAATTYAIQEAGGQFVQAGGTLAASPVYQTAATWATKTVTGLSGATTYTFKVIARNGANNDTVAGPTASGTTLVAPVVLAGWDVSGQTSYGTSPLTASEANAGVVVGGLTRGAGVGTGGSAAARGWGGNTWNSADATTAAAAGQFATFTVKPNTGKSVSFDSISKFDYRSSTTTISGTLQYSLDGTNFNNIATVSYSSNSSSGASIAVPISLSGISALQNVPSTKTVTFRIVNFGAATSGNTWYIYDKGVSTANDFQVSGFVNDSYSVTYDANGGIGSQTDPNSPYIAGTNVTVLGTGGITRTGYTFSHWNTAPDNTGTSYNPGDPIPNISANVTLYAQWSISTYTLTYAAATGGTISGTTSQTVNYGANGTQVTAVPDTGFVFSSWSDGVTTASRTDLNVTANVSVTAFFADHQAPVISYTPLGNTTPATPQPLTVTATDNLAVASLFLFYSVNGGAYQLDVCANTGSNNCTIPGQAAGSAVTYYVRAVDTAGNIAVNPVAGAPNLYTVGGAPITVPTGIYSNVAAANGSSLGGDVTVLSNLDLGGVVTTGANTLTLDCNATVTGAGAGVYVEGAVKKNFCGTAPLPLFAFPVGQGDYTPVDVTITGLNVSPSSLTVTSYASPLAGFDTATSLSRNWGIEKTGDLTATLAFHYLQTDVNGDESLYRVFKRDVDGIAVDMCGGNPCVDTANNVLGPITGVTSFSRWTGTGPLAPTAAGVTLSGRIVTADGNGIRNAVIALAGTSLSHKMSTITGPFGYYQFDDLTAGETYVITVNTKRYTFRVPSRVVTLNDSLTDVDFTADPQQ